MAIKKIPLLTIIISIICINSYSQSNAEDVKFIHDEKISWLVEQHKIINANRDGIQGFRVQIYSDSGSQSKLRTERVKAEFDKNYPDVGSYLIYEEPYFKVRAGNFRTRLDARRFLEKITSRYNYAFIVSDDIDFPEFE